MKKTISLLACLLGIALSPSLHAEGIVGAGSTAAAPLYTKWQEAYAKKTGAQSSYQAVGSSEGVKRIVAGAVDFGASDAPMSAWDLKKNNLMVFPTVILGVVPFVNLAGIKAGELHLTGDLLVGIYSGRITKWNDPAIVQENAHLSLPNQAIVPLARADGSGTTFTLTDYFSRVSAEWKQKFGTAFSIAWPSTIVTVKGSAGLIADLKKTPGAIGYAEYAYVIENKLNYAMLKNRDGRYVKPEARSFKAALAQSGWEKTGDFLEMLTDKPGAASWPITGGTYVMMPKVTSKPQQTAEAIRFFTWSFMSGDDIANSLDYVRLPDRVQARVFQELSGVTDASGKRLAISINVQ
jgi:phosphate transport system substrate-binding protein